MHARTALAVLSAAALLPAAAIAGASPAAEPVGLSKAVQVIGALGLVLVLIFGLAIAAQRMRLGRGTSGKHLRVVDALALGARERLLLVEVAGERVLLGVAGGRIERLHVLGTPAGGDFPAMLDAALTPGTQPS
jgi:flagellar protein FliO/FliZ